MLSVTLIEQHNQAEMNRLTSNIQNDVIKNAKLLLKTALFSGHELPTDDTENLSNSVVRGVNEKGFKTVEYTSPYAVPVEFGMPAGIRVSVDDLKSWVIRKLGITDEAQAMKVAMKIRYKIVNSGIQQTRFLKKAIKLTIGQRGVLTPTVPRSNSKLIKTMKKVNRMTKKVGRVINKFQKIRRRLQ